MLDVSPYVTIILRELEMVEEKAMGVYEAVASGLVCKEIANNQVISGEGIVTSDSSHVVSTSQELILGREKDVRTLRRKTVKVDKEKQDGEEEEEKKVPYLGGLRVGVGEADAVDVMAVIPWG